MKRKYFHIVLVSVSALTVLVAWRVFQSSGKAARLPAPLTSAVPTDGSNAPTVPSIILPAWQAGACATYDLETGVALGPAEEGVDLEPGNALLIRGTLRLEVLRTAPLEVAATLASVDARREGVPDEEMRTMLESTPCKLRLHADGAIEEIAFAPDVPAEDRELVSLACAWEFCAQSKSTWTSEEKGSGPNDRFLASYAVQPGGTVRKVRTFIPNDGEAGNQRVLFSEFFGRLGTLWLDSLEGRESTEMLLDGEPIARSLVHIRLSRRNEAAATPALRGSEAFDAFSTEIAPQPRESVNARIENDRLRQLYGAVPLSVMASKLTAVGGKAMQEKLPALREFMDWLRVHGHEGAMELVAAIQEGTIDPDAAGISIHAVGNTKQAEALASLLEAPEKLAPKALVQAIIEAGGVENPNSRILEALSNLTSLEFPKTEEGEDFRFNDAAWYNLGRLAEKDSALRRRLEDSLLPAVGDKNPAMFEVGLETMANARSDRAEFVQAATSVLNSSNQENSLRISALRFLSQTPALTAESATAALGALGPDVSTDIQAAALEVFQNHPFQLGAATLQRINTLTQSDIQSVAYAARKVVAAANGTPVSN